MPLYRVWDMFIYLYFWDIGTLKLLFFLVGPFGWGRWSSTEIFYSHEWVYHNHKGKLFFHFKIWISNFGQNKNQIVGYDWSIPRLTRVWIVDDPSYLVVSQCETCTLSRRETANVTGMIQPQDLFPREAMLQSLTPIHTCKKYKINKWES